jgi:hypothetical protein
MIWTCPLRAKAAAPRHWIAALLTALALLVPTSPALAQAGADGAAGVPGFWDL